MFNFDVRCVSSKFMSPPTPKMITDAVCFIGIAEKTDRFLTTVDIVLEEYSNYLSNNK